MESKLCIVVDCQRPRVLDSFYCEQHAYRSARTPPKRTINKAESGELSRLKMKKAAASRKKAAPKKAAKKAAPKKAAKKAAPKKAAPRRATRKAASKKSAKKAARKKR